MADFETNNELEIEDDFLLLADQTSEQEDDLEVIDDSQMISVQDSRYWIKINGTVWDKVRWEGLNISLKKYTQRNTASFEIWAEKHTPEVLQEVEIFWGDELSTARKIFGGFVTNIEERFDGLLKKVSVSCQDYSFKLDKMLVVGEFSGSLFSVTKAIVSEFGGDFTTIGVEGQDVQLKLYKANYEPLSKVLDKLCDTYGFEWYIDVNKDLNLFRSGEKQAPFKITDTSGVAVWNSVVINKNIDEIKNSIFVRGGEFVSENILGENLDHQVDGENDILKLGYRYRNYELLADGTPLNVGIDFVNSFEDGFDALYNNQEKLLRFPEDSPLQELDKPVIFRGNRRIPVRVLVEDDESIQKYGQEFQFLLMDTNIESQESALDRAMVEIARFADEARDLEFVTRKNGLNVGQRITVNSIRRGISQDYIITGVQITSRTPVDLEYRVTAMSSQKKDLIDVMQGLLLQQNAGATIADDEAIVFIKSFKELNTWSGVWTDQPFGFEDGDAIEPIWVAGKYYPTDENDRKRVPRTDTGVPTA